MLVKRGCGSCPQDQAITRRINTRPVAAGRPLHCGCASIPRAPLCAGVISIREIRMINRAVLVLLFLLSGSAIAEEKPPELWSWFKDLSKSKEACEIQSSYALQVIGLENQVENEYGIYGNVRSNRVVVKCIEISPTRSKLMVAVAGYNRDSVELVRNKIISSIQ